MESRKERLSKDTYVAVKFKTKEILALEVTADEKVHDSKIMKNLVEEGVLNNNQDTKIKSFIGDAGAYDGNENFKYLKEKRIQPIIKVKKNSIVSTKRISRYGIKKCNYKQRIIINGKRKESMMDNDG